MTQTITGYLHQGIYYCGECIVEVTSYSPPWPKIKPSDQWVEPEEHLNIIARKMRLNRDDAGAVSRAGFPAVQQEPPSYPTFCGECLWWFTDSIPEETPTTEECDMANEPYVIRHQNTMLNPQSDAEKLVVQAFQLLLRIADTHPNDNVASSALEGAARATNVLLEYLTSGTGIDQAILAQEVHDIVDKAGGDTDNI